MQNYHALASTLYRNNPEGTSVMILTIFELWAASDKLAVSYYGMLGEYAPEVPLEPLENLLLPFRHQMARLQKVETYLGGRTRQALADLATCLFSTDSPRSFATRYFNGSQEHQDLRTHILKVATESKRAKQAEYLSTKSEYDRLDTLYSGAFCEYITVVVDAWCNETKQVHKSNCPKCSYLAQRDALQIKVHEWPLPDNNAKSAAVVFELKVPAWFAAWRDSRAFLLHDVLKGDRAARPIQETYHLASDDPHLSHKCVGAGSTRVGLLSQVKPVVRSHYAVKKILQVDVNSVCVANGLRYEYYDKNAGLYMVAFTFNDKIPRACTYTLPTPSLQRYIFRPARSPDGEPPNSVLASQDKCPDAMSLEEFKELTTIPLGHHLQWVNILQQLAMPGVDFKKIETTLTFLQCINQAGSPSNDTLRESHAFFGNDSRALDMIDNLDVAVERIKQNWESAQALSLFASIVTRALALNASV